MYDDAKGLDWNAIMRGVSFLVACFSLQRLVEPQR